MSQTLMVYLALLIAGLLAGVINTVAGGGSFLTLPALIWLGGLDPKLANGTNRVAVLLSSVSATATFHRHGRFDRRLAWRLALPSLAGVPVGCLLAIYLPAVAFERILGVLFLLMVPLCLAKPNLLLGAERRPVRSPVAEALAFFVIGVHVGFVHAGMGLLLLLGLSWFHARELVGATAVKNALGFALTLLAMLFFVGHGQVRWGPGLVMAAGNFAGGYLGAHMALRRGERFILAMVVLVMVVTGVKLIW